MRAYIINLERRSDRRMEMTKKMTDAGLDHTFVDAFDARDLVELPEGTLTPKGLYAIWISHVRAMNAIVRDGDPYALIFEDDAVLGSRLDWSAVSRDVGNFMESESFELVQLGHIAAAYKDGAVRRLIRRTRGTGWPSYLTRLDRQEVRVFEGTTRAGMHAYAISQRLAAALPAYNDPVWMGPNGFFERFASACMHLGVMKLGTVVPSLVEQESRQSVGSSIDSDNLS